MIMEMAEFKNKVLGCWMGKNIGGTIGAPFECVRQVNDVSFYTQDLKGNPAPNDDLDLQLVWLSAVERYGRQVNASILGEYWLGYVTPHWVEYGTGKANLRAGLVPPLSGLTKNVYRNSCGCFIRSEIWACLAPGHPDIAVKYAYEDAIVDHSQEGVYGEIFCAAVESAAFVEKDKWKLIEIGLSYIPEDCGIARGIQETIRSYKSGASWQEARKNVLNAVPGSFGLLGTPEDKLPSDIPAGERGWDAPSNVAIMVLGWLYGEDDFGKSLCIAVNCGEDTDCTAATLGSIFGIIYGFDGIPKEWIEPIGWNIKTVSITEMDGVITIPKTIDELTERVLKQTPQILGPDVCDYLHGQGGYSIHMNEGDALYCRPFSKSYWNKVDFKERLQTSFRSVSYDFVLYQAVLEYFEEPFIRQGEPKKFRLRLESNVNQQVWLNFRWHLPEGWKVSPAPVVSAFLDQYFMDSTILEFTIEAETLTEARYDLLLEITAQGHHTKGLIPIVLLHGYYQ